MVEGMILYNSPVTIQAKPESQVATKNGELIETPQKTNNGEILDFIIDPPDPEIDIEFENTGLDEYFSYTEKDKFRKQHCVDGKLKAEIHQSVFSDVKHEFADAVFPGLTFELENRCNPCNPNCSFSFESRDHSYTAV
jgi:hypothetical protein